MELSGARGWPRNYDNIATVSEGHKIRSTIGFYYLLEARFDSTESALEALANESEFYTLFRNSVDIRINDVLEISSVLARELAMQ